MMHFDDWLGRWSRRPTTAGGERVYAIGDVHGRVDLLRSLLLKLGRDAASRRRRSARVILLGDLIDRGPRSREALELAKRLQVRNAGRFIVLCGNHEDMLLASADGNPDAQRLWIQNGGDTTLLSYRIDPLEFMAMAPEKRAQLLVRSVGADMIMWLAALPVHYRSGDYFFCHAGIRPGVALAKQRREDLLWIRGDFVSSRRRHGAVIVHGHSETTEVEMTKSRINVDTAAYRSGALTAVGLQENLRWFLSTSEKYLNQAELEIALRNRRC